MHLILENWIDNTTQWYLWSRKGWLAFCHEIKNDHKANLHALFGWLRCNGYVRSGTVWNKEGQISSYPYKKQYHGVARPTSPTAFLEKFWDDVTVGAQKG